MSEVERIAEEIHHRFKTELDKLPDSVKKVSRDIGAHENTLGNYYRGKIPDQWAYLAQLHQKGIDIRYVLLGIDPDYSGLTSEESLLLKAYRQLSPEGQEALLRSRTLLQLHMRIRCGTGGNLRIDFKRGCARPAAMYIGALQVQHTQ